MPSELTKKVIALLSGSDIQLHNEKLAVVAQEPMDTFKGSSIIKPEEYKAPDLKGTVVAHGDKLDKETRDRFPIGHTITYNSAGVRADSLIIDGIKVVMFLMHPLDVNWSWPAEMEVESCAE